MFLNLKIENKKNDIFHKFHWPNNPKIETWPSICNVY